MRIDDMECFRVLAETLNYTNAANRLYMTPSSLTRVIQQMEEELGFLLFDRSRRSVSLTAAGQSFYQNCEEVLARYHAVVENARAALEGNTGCIRFAVNVYYANSVVYDILGSFQSAYPDILLQVSSSNTERMLYSLLEREIDCGVCTGRPADHSIERIVLKKYRDCVVLSPSHPLADREELSFTELRQERFSVIAHSLAGRGYEEIRAKARAAGFDARVEENADSVSHLLSIVSTGRYITMLSDNYRNLAGDKLRFVPLADEGTVELAFLWKKDSSNPCVKVLADFVRKNFKRRVGDAE